MRATSASARAWAAATASPGQRRRRDLDPRLGGTRPAGPASRSATSRRPVLDAAAVAGDLPRPAPGTCSAAQPTSAGQSAARSRRSAAGGPRAATRVAGGVERPAGLGLAPDQRLVDRVGGGQRLAGVALGLAGLVEGGLGRVDHGQRRTRARSRSGAPTEPLVDLGQVGPHPDQLLVDPGLLGLRLAVGLAAPGATAVSASATARSATAQVGQRRVGGQRRPPPGRTPGTARRPPARAPAPGPAARPAPARARPAAAACAVTAASRASAAARQRRVGLGLGDLAPLERVGQLGPAGVVVGAPASRARAVGQGGQLRLGLGHGGDRLGVELGAPRRGAARRRPPRPPARRRRPGPPARRAAPGAAVGLVGRGLGGDGRGVELVDAGRARGQALAERGEGGRRGRPPPPGPRGWPPPGARAGRRPGRRRLRATAARCRAAAATRS